MNGNDFFSSDSFYIYLLTVPLGIIIAVIYDLFRVKRLFTVKKAPIVFIDDILFMLITSFILVIFAYEINFGVVRWYMLINTLLSFFAYKIIVGDRIVRLITRIVNAIKRYIIKILKIIFKPLLKLIGMLHKLFSFILCKWKKFYKYQKKVFSFYKKWCKIKKEADYGFRLHNNRRKELNNVIHKKRKDV